MLQYEGPSSFRYAMVDPLGRSLFIMVTDGYTFTMVYNREAKAVTGSTASRFWRDKCRRGWMLPTYCCCWPRAYPQPAPADIRGDLDSAGFWLYAVGIEGMQPRDPP